MNSTLMCRAVVRCVFSPRRMVVVPNVSWGWNLNYEADVIAVSPSGYANEIEIKISKSDLKADQNKSKFTYQSLDPRIRRFWYAVPSELLDAANDPEIVKPEFGIIEVYRGSGGSDPYLNYARIVRRAKVRPARKCSEEEISKLKHLGLMRYWDLYLREPISLGAA